MKEQMTYVAIDADDVGQSIGGAVISDDADELSAISGKINNGVKIFSKWAEYNGGSVISSGSDEAIFKVPLSSIEELEDLKNKYQKLTGFSISIGIGEKISDAAKALIYAKVNGKNQIVDYSPEIEEVMRQSITGNLDQEKPEQKLEGGVGDETEPSDVDSKQLKEGRVVEKEHTDNEEEAEEIALDHLTEDPEYYSKLQEMESSKPKTRRPKFEKEEDEALVDQDSEESEEVEDEDLNLLEEDESEEEEEESFVDQEDLDVDGRPDKQEEHGEITPEDDVDGDGDVEHEEAMAAEAGEEDKYSDEGDFSDEYLDEELADEELADEELADEELADEEQSQQDTESEEEEQMSEDGEKEPEDEMSDEDMEDEDNLDNSIASEMSDENEDELEEGDVTDEALKQAIFDSLQIFKENRDILSSLATQNPDLYNALVISLQSMIEMAKELGYGGYGDNLQQETEPEKLEAEDEESSDQDEDMNPDDYEVSEDMSDSDDVLKNESFYSLVSKINNAKNLLGMKKKEDKKQMLLKLKEKLKKIKNKSSDAKKKPLEDKKKKPPKPKKVEAASFCASSNQKMKTAGHDCRANEDKDSPMCTARKKMNCRGKNAEKGAAVQKSEKLKNFLENKRKKN